MCAINQCVGQSKLGTIDWEKVAEIMGDTFNASMCCGHASSVRKSEKPWTSDDVRGMLGHCSVCTHICAGCNLDGRHHKVCE